MGAVQAICVVEGVWKENRRRSGREENFVDGVFVFLVIVMSKNLETPDGPIAPSFQNLRDMAKLNKIVEKTVAKSVIVYDMSKGEVLASKKPNAIMPLASLAKIFTSGLAYEHFVQLYGKKDKSTLTLLKNIQNMMTNSNNDAAVRIAGIFGNNLEEQLKALHVYVAPYNITFKNVTGLDIKDVGTSVRGRAVDVALATERIYKKYPEIFDRTIIPYFDNTNLSAAGLDFFVAGKTGYTHLTGGNLLVIVQKGITKKYMILVLGSTENGRFVDVEAIATSLLQLDI